MAATRPGATGHRYKQALPDAWERKAACPPLPVDLFAPTRATPIGRSPVARWEPGKKICRGCPVREHCLVAALHDEGAERVTARDTLRGACTPNERVVISEAARAATRIRQQMHAARIRHQHDTHALNAELTALGDQLRTTLAAWAAHWPIGDAA